MKLSCKVWQPSQQRWLNSFFHWPSFHSLQKRLVLFIKVCTHFFAYWARGSQDLFTCIQCIRVFQIHTCKLLFQNVDMLMQERSAFPEVSCSPTSGLDILQAVIRNWGNCTSGIGCSDEQCSITARRFLAQTSGRGVCEDVACCWFPLTVQGLSPSVTWDMDGWIHWDGSKLTSSLWASVMLVFRVL